jgi:hypothetical protein
VAEGVHADLAYAILIADADEGTHEVARLDRPVGFEVLGADACAAQDVGALADFGRPGPQDQREPPGPGVEAGFVAQPLEPVAAQDAPESAGDEPAGDRRHHEREDERGQGDGGPGEGDQECEPPQGGGGGGQDG